HCMITVATERILLKDLGSTNGTLVNGHRLIGERDIVHGDTIQIGPLVIQVRLPEQEALLEAMKQTDPPDNDVTMVDEDVIEQVETVHFPSKKKSE
ncbi:MAG: FHA domain-containing protein, partial [Planctomycetota bacterium]